MTPANRDLALVRAALEAAIRACDEMIDWPLDKIPGATIDSNQYHIGIGRGLVNATWAIRKLDPAAIAASVKVEADERDAENVRLRHFLDVAEAALAAKDVNLKGD
jgi:hypothetical protein